MRSLPTRAGEEARDLALQHRTRAARRPKVGAERVHGGRQHLRKAA